MAVLVCPACRRESPPGAGFCEGCGQRFRTEQPDPASATGRPEDAGTGHWRSSTSAGAPCAGCGAEEGFPDDYCQRCGRRRSASRDWQRCDLGAVAAATDRGRRYSGNEDAYAVGRLGDVTAAVVCDGVGSAPGSDQAAVAAAEAGIDALLRAVAAGSAVRAATEHAAHAAATAAATAAAKTGAPGESSPPSCTYVSALVTAGEVAVGWVGDSRAYWVGTGGARALTVDHTLSGALAAEGVPPDDPRYADPQALALRRWLGADAEPVPATVHTFSPGGPGAVVVCSDGLSRYLAAPDDIAAAAPDGSAAERANALVRYAVDAGGVDNIAVAVLPYPLDETGDHPR